jgi:hypothetical protein
MWWVERICNLFRRKCDVCDSAMVKTRIPEGTKIECPKCGRMSINDFWIVHN